MRINLAVLATAILLTACASSDQVAPLSSTPGNKAAAIAETDRLVASASLPPNAIEVHTRPAGLTGPALGTPQMKNLIDTKRYFTVPLSLAKTADWLERHPQRGFSLGGSAGGDGKIGSITTGFGYGLSPAPHFSWGDVDLEIGLAAASTTTTAIRVDGVAEWINPTPVSDSSTGPAIRLSISQGCPATDRTLHDVSNPDAPDLKHQLLPNRTPTAGLRCSYDGANGKPFQLIGARHLTAKQAAGAAAQIRALPSGSHGLGGHSCPSDDGRATIDVFGYQGRADVDIWEHTSGCASTDNGYIASGDF